jgi:hypothetical protein
LSGAAPALTIVNYAALSSGRARLMPAPTSGRRAGFLAADFIIDGLVSKTSH